MQPSPYPSMSRPFVQPLRKIVAVGLVLASVTACAADSENDSGNLDAGAPDGGGAGSTESSRASKAERPDEHTPLGATTFHDECAQTREDVCNDCQSGARQREAECWSACRDAVTYGGPVVSCVELCGDISSSDTCSSRCEEPSNTCAARRYRFEITAPQLPDILKACESATARDVSCDQATVGVECGLYARVERQEAVAAYMCVSTLDCGADAMHCFSLLGESTLGADMAASCDEEGLDEDTIAWLDGQGRWVRSEVQQDLRVCQQLCGTGDFKECVTAWLEATVGEQI